jgi:hypothetical protein
MRWWTQSANSKRERKLTLEQEIVLDTVATLNPKLARSLLRCENFECRTKAGDSDCALSSSVGTGNSEIEIFCGEKFRRDVLEFEESESREVLVDLAEDL